MQAVIGVMGSASKLPAGSERLAHEVGREIARAGCTLVTGATTGLPLEAARGAKAEGGWVVGISPAENRSGHRALGLPAQDHDFILYSGFGFKGRNILNIRACDAVVTVGGSVGTLNELTSAVGEGKPVGVLLGSGGVSDGAAQILKICGLDPDSILVAKHSPARLIAALLDRLH